MNTEIIVTLISQIQKSNDMGEIVNEEQKTDIFAIKKSVRQSEFFQAAACGFKPEIVIEVYSFEYSNQTYCIVDGQRFKIYRVYPLNSDRVELYLTAIVGETNVTS